mmetsp:Transcript_39631/g.97978  ORF Transcript_39631/g.97978 Transcript_39631/m.97978 type:complete len:368 (-) Transcript_39631:279-1382(-)
MQLLWMRLRTHPRSTFPTRPTHPTLQPAQARAARRRLRHPHSQTNSQTHSQRPEQARARTRLRTLRQTRVRISKRTGLSALHPQTLRPPLQTLRFPLKQPTLTRSLPNLPPLPPALLPPLPPPLLPARWRRRRRRGGGGEADGGRNGENLPGRGRPLRRLLLRRSRRLIRCSLSSSSSLSRLDLFCNRQFCCYHSSSSLSHLDLVCNSSSSHSHLQLLRLRRFRCRNSSYSSSSLCDLHLPGNSSSSRLGLGNRSSLRLGSCSSLFRHLGRLSFPREHGSGSSLLLCCQSSGLLLTVLRFRSRCGCLDNRLLLRLLHFPLLVLHRRFSSRSLCRLTSCRPGNRSSRLEIRRLLFGSGSRPSNRRSRL